MTHQVNKSDTQIWSNCIQRPSSISFNTQSEAWTQIPGKVRQRGFNTSVCQAADSLTYHTSLLNRGCRVGNFLCIVWQNKHSFQQQGRLLEFLMTSIRSAILHNWPPSNIFSDFKKEEKNKKKFPVQIQNSKFFISISFPNYAADSVKEIPLLYFFKSFLMINPAFLLLWSHGINTAKGTIFCHCNTAIILLILLFPSPTKSRLLL